MIESIVNPTSFRVPCSHGYAASNRRITKRNDPLVKRIRALSQREDRDRTGLFLMEGSRFVFQALQHHIPVKTLIIAPDLLASAAGQRLARLQARNGVPCLEVSADVFHSISGMDDPQGIAAVARQQWLPLSRVRPDHGLCWVALETVQSPGNLGTLLRTCDAVGAAGIVLLGSGIDPYDPGAVRATMGALFSQRFVRASLAEFAAWKRKTGCTVVGTSPSGCTDYQQLHYPRTLVLLMGGERKGLPPEMQSLCDHLVSIPMVGSSDSLNLGVATSVMLYEIFSQRRRG